MLPADVLLVERHGVHVTDARSWNWQPLIRPMPTCRIRCDSGQQSSATAGSSSSTRFATAGRKTTGGRDPCLLLRDESAWAAMPLIHHERLVGLVLLAAPEYRRPLDWEDFDLLRTAGRQAASSLAEAQGQEALAKAQRFDEFNRRFAFILHDIKNLVSQLSLLARNAERHADNPEFRADMIATLQSSVGKMNDLLARLAPHAASRAVQPRRSRWNSDPSMPPPLPASGASRDVRLLGNAAPLGARRSDRARAGGRPSRAERDRGQPADASR